MWRHMPLFLYRSLFEFAAIITMGMRHFVDASNDYLHKLFYTPCRILNRLERNINMDKDLCFFLERGGLYEKLLVLVTSFLLMFGCMMLVSGCGGDKFAGEWVGVGPDTFRGGKLIHRIKIDKNGSNGKSYMVAWANLDLDSSKPENNAVQLQ